MLKKKKKKFKDSIKREPFSNTSPSIRQLRRHRLLSIWKFRCMWLRCKSASIRIVFFFFQAEDGIRDLYVTGVQTCALPISRRYGEDRRRNRREEDNRIA